MVKKIGFDYHNKGYGTVLFDKAKEYVLEMNTKQLLIETQNNNPKAIDFMRKKVQKFIKLIEDITKIYLKKIN